MKGKLTSALLVHSFVLSTALPLQAGEIRFTKEVLAFSPESTRSSIPSFEIVPFRLVRATADSRSRDVFQRNPITQPVWNKQFTAEETEEDLIFVSGPFEFWINKTTGSEILLNLDRYAHADEQEDQIADEVLRRKAVEYVSVQFPDIDPKQLRFSKIRRQMDAVGVIDSETQAMSAVRERVANHIAIFERVIGQIPVIGPGEKLRVYFSSGGEVIGHSRIWRRVGSRTLTRAVVSAEEIRRRFIEAHTTELEPDIEVDRIYFGYFADGRYTRQRSLAPVYIVGYTYGPHSKRVLEVFDAYTGRLVSPTADEEGSQVK